MKRILLVVIFMLMFPLFISASDEDKDVFYFFYSYKCPHCVEAHPFIDKLKKEYPDIIFKDLEVMKVLENRELFKKMIGKLG
ncbi:MAG: thioredoxin family protein, partial [bacterium]|nr:thioredoxin family protein [bacterium]